MIELEKNYRVVQDKISKICIEANRNPLDICLLAVSKYHSSESIAKLAAIGHQDFAENYLQELEEKSNNLSNNSINWHFIGKLQSNKIAKIVKICSSIHSLSKIEHAKLIAKYALDIGKRNFPVYVEVNLENEHSKSGLAIEDVPRFVENIKLLEGLSVMGLMAIPPQKYNDADCLSNMPVTYKMFADLNRSLGFSKLSLGMTADLAMAIKAGSTCLRIGSAIFGSRS